MHALPGLHPLKWQGAESPGQVSPPILIHVGFPKTATTALQNHVFPHMSGVWNLGKPTFSKPVKRALRSMARDEPGRFDRRACDVLRKAFQGAPPGTASILISHEGFTGSRFQQSDSKKVLRSGGFRALRIAAMERLHAACEGMPVKILFNIREQCSWLLSVHADLVLRDGLSLEFGEWLEAGLNAPDDFYADPDFRLTIDAYSDLFGKENVHVVAFEEMSRSPQAFAEAIARAGALDREEISRALMALPRTKSREQLMDPTNLIQRRRYPQGQTKLRLAVQLLDAVPAALRRKVSARCADGNRVLAARFGLKLAELDYAMPWRSKDA